MGGGRAWRGTDGEAVPLRTVDFLSESVHHAEVRQRAVSGLA